MPAYRSTSPGRISKAALRCGLLRSVLSSTAAVGVSGARSPRAASVAALRQLAGLVPPSAQVLTGCALGTDALARQLFPSAKVFSASSWGRSRGAFAARSIACVRAVRAAGGVWCAFPGSHCPAGLLPTARPGAAFSGLGSGTWASLALAAGSGCACIVFCPPGVAVPTSWGFQQLGGGWWLLQAGTAPGCQRSLL